jgi:hypothetical protein
MKFSQRIGKVPIKSVLQVNSMDEDLENRLWNIILRDFFEKLSDSTNSSEDSVRGQVFLLIWRNFFNNRVDEIPTYINSNTVYPKRFIAFFKKWYFQAAWYEIYDFIEYLANMDQKYLHLNFIAKCNNALQQEVAGYRIINGRIVQITSEEEIQEIEEAFASKDKFETINTHLKASLTLLSDRKHPDYRNSIKESISAVEAICIIIAKDKNASLGKALNIIENTHSIHKSLKSAFSSIYGYTSDSSGIRHALTEEDVPVGFEDAKFMLVSCSAFINYLRSKMKI